MPTNISISEQAQKNANEFIASLPESEQQTVKSSMQALMESDIDSQAIKVGDLAPDFSFDVLSDVSNQVIKQYGLCFVVDESMRPLYLQWGIDVPQANGDETYELPIPATYVIDQQGIIRAAHVDKNYINRMDPEDIVLALKALS